MHINSSVSGTKIIRAADKGVLAACIGAIAAVYILDALFFAAWAPERYLIPVFLLIGVVIRTVAVFAGVALQWVRGVKEIRLARQTVRGLWILCLIACLVPAMSFFAGGHNRAQSSQTVAAAVETASVESKAVRIARLESQITRVEETTRESIAEANQTIEAITNDGVAGISASDNQSIASLRAEIRGYRDDANVKVTSLEQDIATIEQEREADQTVAAEAKTRISPFSAIFHVVGGVTNTDPNAWSIGVLFFFALLIEAIAAFGLGAYYDIHRFFVARMQELQLQEAGHDSELSEIQSTNQGEVNDAGNDEKARSEDRENGDDGQDDEIRTGAEAGDETVNGTQEETVAELTPQQARARKGGLANAHYNQAEKSQSKIPVRDQREVEAA